jgi:outer membrane translocation and assembly module TamA
VNQRFVLLALVQISLLPRLLCAQLPPRLERCFPYPTFAQEISAMHRETKPPEPEPRTSSKVVIASVKFAPATDLPEYVRDRITWSIKSRFYDDSELSWLKEMQEVVIRGALQDSGYFKAKVKADARLVEGNERRRRYALTLHIDEGRRYRLGDVRFERVADDNPLSFSASELRKYVQMGRGEFFNVSKVRQAMEELTKLYATRGYIDMVPQPEIQNDEDGGPIELVLKIDEGKQYRVGKIQFLGLDEKAENQLIPQLKPGEPYNSNLVDEVLKRNKSVLPADASRQDMHLTRNTKEGVVDMHFDFYSCPNMEN